MADELARRDPPHRARMAHIRRYREILGVHRDRVAARRRVVAVRLEASIGCSIARGTWRGPAAFRVTFGAPMLLSGADYDALATQVEHAVRGL